MAYSIVKFSRNLGYLNKINVRSVVSALHIPGGQSSAAVSILTPSLTHIDTMIRNKPKLQHNLKARNYQFNLEAFIQVWDEMNALRVARENLETKRNQVNQVIKGIVSKRNKTDSQFSMDYMKEESKRLREELKQLSPRWNEVENRAVTEALNLPNYLHLETPAELKVIETFKPLPTESFPNPELQDKIRIDSPTSYYLEGPLAQMELDWIENFSQALKSGGFEPMTGPDFVKSIVVDGCGLEFANPDKVYSLAQSQEHGNLSSGKALHLVGGASLPSVVALLTKVIVEEPFPLRLMSIGRRYEPKTLPLKGLLNVAQSSAIQLLTVMENHPDDLFSEAERIQNLLVKQLEELDVHFRTVALPAGRLERWEQYRSSLEVYFPSVKGYVEVANVSLVGDYISRRLAIYGPERKHPGFVTSSALSVPKLLACYLENHSISQKREESM
jgi:seryl-tRNA synthetase